LRWANDKYKGTLAFRATLWHREDDKSAEARAACLEGILHREEIQGFPHTPHKDGKHLCGNSWQTISQAARDRNTAIEKQAQRKNQCCTTLAAIHRLCDKNPHEGFLKKFKATKKNCRVCISSG
jgi:hypothetical protein